MDRLDEEILGILGTNGRISFSDLGKQIGLSTAATAARVRRLEAAGVILGYSAILADQEVAAGGGLEAFIDVRLAEGRDSTDFLAWAQQERKITDAVHLTGPYDYLLRAQVRDTGELDLLLRRLKRTAGAAATQTRIALRGSSSPSRSGGRPGSGRLSGAAEFELVGESPTSG